MANKRQQARNERALERLIKEPGKGNTLCADCEKETPGKLVLVREMSEFANVLFRLGKLECKSAPILIRP